MDERTYQLFTYYKGVLEFFKTPESALWATKHHIERSSYTKADLQAVLAEVERQKADTSPMVHLSQHQLDEMVRGFYPMTVPDELSA
ncbi:hypothetical protein [Mesorhizobium sp. B2-3-4]|uniref:hypothetical protein n=1 Tax=Mesorhizobium sp. B2-3-4 TaxID=2589959 RepID=UPI001129190E|nr:hypothetical protein [Mesorhizobium sp. B2-3-4]TPM41386.1 hypothetical protein FJ967_00165 [Mesorhizobium sp. B2-3-4]